MVNNKYTIGEFAKRTGVTVRTLHYYDELGMLIPNYTANGRRTYDDSHFIAMQKITVFKLLGYTLEQTKELLLNNEWDIKESLLFQKRVMEEKIHHIKKSIETLDHAINLVSDNAVLDVDIFASIIQGVYEKEEHKEWLSKIYSEEKVEEIFSVSPERQQELEKSFLQILSSLKEKQGQDPHSEDVQQLIRGLMSMLEEIVGEDLNSFFERTEGSGLSENDPLYPIPLSTEEQDWIKTAINIYLQQYGVHKKGDHL